MNINSLLENLTFYDTDAIKTDYENNNFDLDNWREEIARYYCPSIVATSWINGQRTQAREQFKRYEVSADDMRDQLSENEIISLIS